MRTLLVEVKDIIYGLIFPEEAIFTVPEKARIEGQAHTSAPTTA